MIRAIQTTALSALILLFCMAQTIPAQAQNAAPDEAAAVVEKSKSDSASKPSTSSTKSTSSAKSTKPADSAEELAYTDTFGETATDLIPTGRNPFFILEPGFTMVYAPKDGGDDASLVITVLKETKKVDGVETRIVEERESEDGQLVEVSRNYFAISQRTNNVYYFGEDSRTYKNGKETNRSGSWEAGAKGARYGLMMPGCALLGARYYQEIAPGDAMDRAENVSVTAEIETPAGNFTNCLKTRETTPLEPGVTEYKLYAPGVGLVLDGDLVLSRYGMDINVPAATGEKK